MLIRELEPADIPALAALAAKTYAETFGHSMSPEDLAAELRDGRSEVYFRAAAERDTILVVVFDDVLAGYVQLGAIKTAIRGAQPGPRDQAVKALYVHAEYRGRGLGRALMDAAFAHPRFAHVDYVYIDVWEQNTRALEFYKRYGFEVVGECDVTVEGRVVDQDLVLRRQASPAPR